MVDIKDVARKARVSLGTVSNVLNHPDLVADSTRARVERAISDLGYVRHGSARQLRAGRSHTVGLVVPDITNPFFTSVARGVEDAVSEAGCVLIQCNSDDSQNKQARYLTELAEQRVLGVIITPVDSMSHALWELLERDIPVVLLDRPTRDSRVASVAVDDVLGGEIAARHLLELGHRRFAFVSGPRRIRQYRDRRQGFRRVVTAAGLDADGAIIEVVRATMRISDGVAAVEQLVGLTNGYLPTAIFCANDFSAIGVLQALQRRGISVPDDVAVIGYDDIDVAEFLFTPLSSVRQPKYELGQEAGRLLLGRVKNPGLKGEHIRFQPELVARLSTARRRRARHSMPATVEDGHV